MSGLEVDRYIMQTREREKEKRGRFKLFEYKHK